MFMIYELDVSPNILARFERLSVEGEKTNMTDLSIIEEQDKIKNIVSYLVDTNSYFYGNIFNHNNPFTIHSDTSSIKKSILLVPIKAKENQKFIVFDQELHREKELSWIYNVFDDKTQEELEKMYYHTSSKSRPFDTPEVIGCIDRPISEYLFQYLPYTRDLYYGLTGWVWDYKPGKALLFPATKLHATGRMTGPKIGCTIQFTEILSNQQILASARNLL